MEEYFEGSIANERAVIELGNVLPIRTHFNYRAGIKGTFRVFGREKRVLFFILDEKNYDLRAGGGDFIPSVSTGKVPSGTVSRVLEPETYFLVFDNRASEENVVVDIDLRAE